MNTAVMLEQFRSLKVLVVGDMCLDRWCRYDPAVSENSRETGIPRLGVVGTQVTPGAGGTVANNLIALGVGQVSVLGAIGQDGFGWELLNAFKQRDIATDLLVSTAGINTFTYTKLINVGTEREDQPRVDFINTTPLPEECEAQLIDTLERVWHEFDVILVVDQAETATGGAVTPALRERICDLAANDVRKVVWADSRERGELFRNVILKLNRDEAEAASLRGVARFDLQGLVRKQQLRTLIVTLGQEGAEIVPPAGDVFRVGGRAVAAIDVCGAGDSFSAGAACALRAAGSIEEAVRFGNLVASITVTKRGTGTASPEEIAEAERELYEHSGD